MAKSIIAAAIAASLAAAPATATDLLANGSFESGGLAGWEQFDDAPLPVVACGPGAVAASAGACFAAFGEGGGALGQRLGLEGGKRYTLSFDYATIGLGQRLGQRLGIFLDDIEVASIPDLGIARDGVWQPNSTKFKLIPKRVLGFSASNLGAGERILIDNVAITASAVPEPATWALMILGFGAVGLAARRRPSGAPRVHA